MKTMFYLITTFILAGILSVLIGINYNLDLIRIELLKSNIIASDYKISAD